MRGSSRDESSFAKAHGRAWELGLFALRYPWIALLGGVFVGMQPNGEVFGVEIKRGKVFCCCGWAAYRLDDGSHSMGLFRDARYPYG